MILESTLSYDENNNPVYTIINNSGVLPFWGCSYQGNTIVTMSAYDAIDPKNIKDTRIHGRCISCPLPMIASTKDEQELLDEIQNRGLIIP